MAVESLRIVAVASFVPAFPLLLAHGIVSHSPVPATGLVPLAFSASASLFILSRQNKRNRDSAAEAVQQNAENEESVERRPRSILTFTVDLVLAAAILIVLIFSWLKSAKFNGQQATLAAYATIPLLINFTIHLYLAVRNFSTGLALHSLTQYVAWQVVPADCPDCGHRLRPSSPPRIPWFESARRIQLPTTPGLNSGNWKVPSWLKRKASGSAGLLRAEEGRYTDEPEGSGQSTHVEEPTEVVVSPGKKIKRTKDGPLPASDGNDEPQW